MRNLILSAAALAAFTSPAYATVLLNDTFDTEAGGASSVPYSEFANFTVSSGSVDLIGSPNDYGIKCVGNSGSCVDTAGSTGGTLTSKQSYNFVTGQTVTLSFDISGNQRTGAGTSNSYFVNLYINPFTAFGPANSATFSSNGGFTNFCDILTTGGCDERLTGAPDATDSYLQFTGSIDAAQGFITDSITFIATQDGSLAFAIGTTDNTATGPVLDNVTLTAVPEPASWAMMILGMGLAGAALRRRNRTAVSYAF